MLQLQPQKSQSNDQLIDFFLDVQYMYSNVGRHNIHNKYLS